MGSPCGVQALTIDHSLLHILCTSTASFSPCPYGMVVVMFHFDSGGGKKKKVVGLPSNVDWSRLWHEISDAWNGRVMHPSHLLFSYLLKTDMIRPFGVCNCDGGWACVVGSFFSVPSMVLRLWQNFRQVCPRSTPITW